ncbi:MAG TPA: SH3 domain-containing protein, partial [Caldilineaceae bacterium]|nr:SH3 domain-containing protein [Caldilineaceae bacterium]
GPPRPGLEEPDAPYAQVDGNHPLMLEYEVTADDLERGGQWLVQVVNLNGGSVDGRLDIDMDRHMFAQQLRLDVPMVEQTLLGDGDSLAYVLDVPPGAGTLTIEMAGPSEASFDLFARPSVPVLPGARAWRGAGEGSQRTIRLADPPPGILHILVRSAAGEGRFQLSATTQDNAQTPNLPHSFVPGSLRRVDPERAADGLNLRTGAGVNYPAFLSIPPNAVVAILGDPVEVSGSPWVRVRYPAAGRSGWVNGSFLLPPAADDPHHLFSGDPRNSAFLCDGGFQSDCDFGNCALDHRLVWGPFCREADHDGIRPGRYAVTVDGSGRVQAGATDFGSSEALFSLGRHELQLPASFEFCWPGREPNGYGFETIVTSQDAGATVTGITLTYQGESCTLSALPPEPSGLVAEIVQTGPMSQAPEVERRLVFEVMALDAGQGLMDGAGIENVRLEVYDGDGNLVYAKTEVSAGYCAFGGGTPDCGVWDFVRARNRWPNGNRFTPGPHLLFATANAQSGEQATVEMVVDLQ